MAVFNPRPLQVPNLTQNYAAENAAFANLGHSLGNLIPEFKKQQLDAQKQQLLGSLVGANPDFSKVGLGIAALGDVQGGAAIAALGQKQQQIDGARKVSDMFSGAGLGGNTGAAPVASAAPVKGDAAQIENRFVSTIKGQGLTNPFGLGAVAAYGNAESGFSPKNVTRVWNDPSESGAPGASGGIMSWRNERLEGLKRFAQERGESPQSPSVETQALYLAKEDPQLIPRLQAAKNDAEANQVMANAWRFAGYNREGGENARRLGLTQQYSQRYAAAGAPTMQMPELPPQQEAQQPAQVAQGSGTYAQSTPEELQGFLNNPRVPQNMKVMMREELARRQGGQAPVQVAQAPAQPGAPVSDAANMPAPAAAPVTGPGTTQAAQAQGFAVPGTSLPPNDPYPHITTRQLYGVASNPNATAEQQRLAQSLIERRLKYTDENAPDKREMVRLQTEELRRKVEGDGGRPMTEAERKAYNVPAGQPAYMKRNGDPGFGPAGTNVNIDQKGETEEAKEIGKSAGKRAGEMMAAANSGSKQLQRIGQLDVLLKNVESGRLQPGRMSMAALGKSLGVSEEFLQSIGLDPKAVGDAQAINAITGRMVVDMIGSGGFPANNFSDADRAFITGTVPSLANDPRGNKIIMEAAKRSAQIDIEKAKSWRDWRKENKGGSFDDFEVQWNEQLGSKDRFSDLAKEAEALVPKQATAPGADWQDMGGGIRIRRKQ